MADLEKFGIIQGRGKEYEEAIYSLALIYNICDDRISSFLSKFDLSIGKFNILVALRFHGGNKGLSQVDISKHLIVTPSNMTKLLDKLEKEGYVKRFALADDRRVNIIKVTPKTENLLDSLWAQYGEILKGLTDGLTAEDRQVLAKKLVKWLGILAG